MTFLEITMVLLRQSTNHLIFMVYRESIEGYYLTLEESRFEGEYIVKWRGLTVATAATETDGMYAGQYAITEWSVD